MKTGAPGVLGIPGGQWGPAPDSSGRPWGYYVQDGEETRRVDTSYLSEDLACLIGDLKPELALPWGFLLQQGQSAVLVDPPHFSQELVEAVGAVAPVTHILFTHVDFINMAEPEAWSKAIPGLVRVAHAADAGDRDFEVLLQGTGPWSVAGLRVDAAPGHTAGSVIVSSPTSGVSFGGDSMGFWEGRPTGFPKTARFSCAQQAASLRSFADEAPFCELWLPGHGLPVRFSSPEDRREQLYRVAEELEAAPEVGASRP